MEYTDLKMKFLVSGETEGQGIDRIKHIVEDFQEDVFDCSVCVSEEVLLWFTILCALHPGFSSFLLWNLTLHITVVLCSLLFYILFWIKNTRTISGNKADML